MAISLLAAACQEATTSAQPVSPVAASAHASAARIRYPSGRYGTLHVAQGQQRIVYSMLNTRQRMNYGDFVWNDEDVPVGTTWVRIDLAHQTLSVFRAGHEIGSTVILFGENAKPTPVGIFPVLQKKVEHRSSLYDAEMPYMLRLTGDGVAVHASHVRKGAATHGCIGIPLAFARLLYAQIKIGDEIAIVAS